MKAIALAAAAFLVVLSGCSSGDQDVVAETAEKLEELKSGVLDLRVSTTAGSETEEQAEAGFELIGSFQLPDEGSLPVADLEYTDLGADEPATRGFISTGEQVFIGVEGQAYELPEEQTQGLLGGSGHDAGIFEEAAVEDWLIDPEVSEGESLEGTEVDRVSGELDVVTALNDLFAIAERFGSATAFTPIEGDEAERLENAVQSSHMEIASGTEDRLLRYLLVEVELGLDDGQDLADLLGPLAGAAFRIEMSISEPNEPIQVEAPSEPLPIEDLAAP